MAMLYFVLDLRSLCISLQNDVKQCLLQLANLYGIFVPRNNNPNFLLEDRIGLCYIPRSSSSEVQAAYSPSRHSFRLVDFHRAVNGLPSVSYSPQIDEDGRTFGCGSLSLSLSNLHAGSQHCLRKLGMLLSVSAPINSFSDLDISRLMNDRVFSALGENDMKMKVIFIGSSLPGFRSESTTRETLLEAADKGVSFEFVFLELRSNQFSRVSESLMDFKRLIGNLLDCSADVYLPDAGILHGLVKRWLQDLKRDLDPHLQACLIFKRNIISTIDKIFCSASMSVENVTDVLSTSQLKVDDDKITISTSGWSNVELNRLSIDLNLVERTNLASLCEGAMMGIPYVVFPSPSHNRETDSKKNVDFQLNIQLFQALSQALHHLDQGLICWSNFDINCLRRTALRCYYVLQSSDKGLMLLRRIAGAEEISLLPDTNFSRSITEELRNSVQESLLELEVKDYNPIMHVSGLHQNLSMLIEESLQVRCGNPDETRLCEQSDPLPDVLADDDAEDQQMECLLAQEWEQLVVDDNCKLSHLPLPPIMERSDKAAKVERVPPFGGKQHRIAALSLDKTTSRILERLEAPIQQRLKTTSSSPQLSRSCDK